MEEEDEEVDSDTISRRFYSMPPSEAQFVAKARTLRALCLRKMIQNCL